MKKYFFFCLFLALTASFSAFAENNNDGTKKRSGFMVFGVDNDDKDYLIASPGRNWYLSGGIGIQTYIGNERAKQARWNYPTPQIHIEVGKWILPDLAFSFNFSGLNSYSQSTGTAAHPWVDLSRWIVYEDLPQYKYYTCKFWNMAFDGLVTLDWTTLCRGFEAGNKRRVHVHTPVGLGVSLAFNNTQNELYNQKKGTATPNFELNFTAGLNVDIRLTRHLSIYPGVRIMLARGTLDYAPTETDVYAPDVKKSSRLDLMPSAFVGVRYGFFKDVTKERASESDVKAAMDMQNVTYVRAIENVPSKRVFDGGSLFTTTDEQKETIQILTAKSDSLDKVQAGLEKDIVDAQNKIDELEKELKRIQESRKLTPMEEALLSQAEDKLACTRVYFKLDKYDLDVNGRRKLENFAEIIKSSNNSAVFYIIGAADKATGTTNRNIDLSRNRCEVIYNYLIKNCGIPASKLSKKPIGGIDDYGANELNRVGLVVISSSKLTDIVNKYSK